MKPKPYYEDESVTIYNGDCQEVLPTLGEGFADCVLTDPPYGLNIGYGRTALGLRHIAGDTDTALISWISKEAINTLGPMGWVVVFCGYTQLGKVQEGIRMGGLREKTCIVWDKMMPGLGEGIRNQHEFAVLAKKGNPPEPWTGGNVWQFTRSNGRPEHPHQKPIKLMGRLVDCYSPPGGVILDPFMGSGSTLRAAKDRGRKAIGIEVEERYCEIAVARLGQECFDLGEAA